jgi:hypothetical protein
MICSLCKKDKSEHLFPPSELMDNTPTCTKCRSERNGNAFGSVARERLGFKRVNWRAQNDEKKFSISKQINQQETQRLLDQRRQRLKKPRRQDNGKHSSTLPT